VNIDDINEQWILGMFVGLTKNIGIAFSVKEKNIPFCNI